ncbi:relaxase, partial [Escherichia coli]|nr:relaxase [Escherichia coli]
MLIRVKGYNDGVKEYLEEGKKNGRDLSRNELDERLILHGDLELTQQIYRSIPDHGQDRYLSITHSYFEDNIEPDVFLNVINEYKKILNCAYRDDEINIYAEAHLPKIKQIIDKKTGDMID